MKKRFSTEGVTLSYSVEGQGEPFILMHGWGCSSNTLQSIEKILTPYFKVYNIDFPGFGESSEPLTAWGIEEYTRIVEKWLASENIVAPIMLGHSFGGRVGILFASRNDVKKLILTGAAGIVPKRGLNYYRKVYYYKTMKKLTLLLLGKTRGEAALEKRRRKTGSSDYRNCTEMMRKIFVKVVNEDLKHVMPQIKAPTLLLWGEDDTATPVHDAMIMQSLIPNNKLVILAEGGHYSFLDDPQGFSKTLKDFIKDEINPDK